MTVKDEERLLKLEEAASRLRVKPNTLRKWLRTGYIPGLKISSSWRLKVENLEDFIKFREAETKKEIEKAKK
jgi:excisionase family DNA binding protein